MTEARDVITLILPMYNEEGSLPALFERLNEILPKIEAEQNVRFELVFVDDGSSDGTLKEVHKHQLKFPAEVLVLSRNFGKEAALTAGLDTASGAAVILMDSDLQHPPELIADMIRAWRDGAEVVYAYKASRESEGLSKSLLSKVFYGILNAESRFSIEPNAGDFRLLDARVVEAVRQMPERERMMKGLFAWVGFRQVGLPLEVPDRISGESKFNGIRLARLAIDGLTSFTVTPIRYMTVAGFAIASMSFLYLFYVLIERIFVGSPFSGFASIVVLIAFFGGVNMICIGLIGEYVGKALLEAKSRPVYIVSRRITLGDSP